MATLKFPTVQDTMVKYFPYGDHSYQYYEKQIDSFIDKKSTILDIGCGRTAPVLKKYIGRAKRLIGTEVIAFTENIDGIEFYNNDIVNMHSIESNSVDLVFCRSVMEHITEPSKAYKEVFRILKPGGHFIFLTANFYDYASIIAHIIPNRFHASIVKAVEGRNEEDTFPTAYTCNTRKKIMTLAQEQGFEISEFQYMGQYPCYLVFNRVLFWLGSMYELFLRRYESLHFLQGWIYANLKKPLS
ncbi:MAG: class I SAM-dependent methyltransferase [Emcibacter sp.]|nr:class I SAM-dependent methyltransferase [Emcibacter sp.]